MPFPEPEIITTNGIQMAVYEARPATTARAADVPPILFLHGFPELAFSWRHQFPALSEAGFHVLAPDQRGYGKSESPVGIAAYHMTELVADLMGLLDARGIEKAIFCGHDWGSLVLWSLPFYAQERLAGLISLNVPFLARRSVDPVSMMNARFGENNYINFFQTPEIPEQLLEADIEKTFRFFMRRRKDRNGPEQRDTLAGSSNNNFMDMLSVDEANLPGKGLLNADELKYYAEHFAVNGFNGPLNWYRNFVPNWQHMEQFQQRDAEPPLITLPVLMILAENDPVLPPALAAGMEQFCPDMTTHLVKNCGHWTQQEKPAEVNQVIINWLGKNF